MGFYGENILLEKHLSLDSVLRAEQFNLKNDRNRQHLPQLSEIFTVNIIPNAYELLGMKKKFYY